MFLLMDVHSGFPVHYNNSDGKKKRKSGQTIHSFNASSVCWIMSCHLFRHHPGADSAHAQVRPEQHTLISVFKLNSCKLCQFKHKSQSSRAQWGDLCVRSLDARKPAPQNERIKVSLKYCVWMDKFTQKLCQNARLGKYPSRHSRLNVLDQCILLKWQHFLNINEIPKPWL